MQLHRVIAYERARIQNPWVRLPLLALGGCLLLAWAPVLAASGSGRHPVAWLVLMLSAFALPALVIWTSPAPWLWTGGRASHTPILRGVIQSAAFNGAAVMLLGLFQVGIIVLSGLDRSWLKTLGGLHLGLFMVCPAAMLAGYFITLWERTRYAQSEAERRLREAQWVLLRGQLSPHVLFNALNGLAELVHIDADAAERGILNLSDLYRTLLAHGSKPKAPLGEERALVERFLEVESMRLGDRLRVAWRWDSAFDDLELPPFLVQPLVENALKHGINPCTTGGELDIELAQEDRELVIRVRNTGQALPLLLGNGVGVANLEARLGLAFGSKASLRLRSEDGWTVAEIRMDLETARRKG